MVPMNGAGDDDGNGHDVCLEGGGNGDASLAVCGGNNEDVRLTACGGAVADVTWMWVELVSMSIRIKPLMWALGKLDFFFLVVDGDVGQWDWRWCWFGQDHEDEDSALDQDDDDEEAADRGPWDSSFRFDARFLFHSS